MFTVMRYILTNKIPVVADGIGEVEEEAEPMNHIEQQLPTAASKVTVPLQR